MNWDIVEGNWKQFKGKVKGQWGKLTDDQLDVIAGKRIELAGKIQEAYGLTQDEVENQIREFERHQSINEGGSFDEPIADPASKGATTSTGRKVS